MNVEVVSRRELAPQLHFTRICVRLDRRVQSQSDAFRRCALSLLERCMLESHCMHACFEKNAHREFESLILSFHVVRCYYMHMHSSFRCSYSHRIFPENMQGKAKASTILKLGNEARVGIYNNGNRSEWVKYGRQELRVRVRVVCTMLRIWTCRC